MGVARRGHLVSGSAEETRQLGEQIGRRLRRGDVVALSGPLGAGKTTLARGIAAGWGVRVPVRSPSFTLVHEYQTERGTLYHLDLFRLSSSAEAEEAGLAEFLPGDGVAVVEWPETAGSLLPEVRLHIRLEMGSREEERQVILEAHGDRFVAWLEELGVALC